MTRTPAAVPDAIPPDLALYWARRQLEGRDDDLT